jgi:ATP-dependent DNA helicase RecG
MRLTEASMQMGQQLLSSLVTRAESRHLEFKRVSGKMVHKALETLCAFANTEGGILALGIADLKDHSGLARVFGVEENKEALDELLRKVQTDIQPTIAGLQVLRVPTGILCLH